MKINFEVFMDSLKYMGVGMVSIFLIISIIVIVMAIMRKVLPSDQKQ